jgi:hypothetical protein
MFNFNLTPFSVMTGLSACTFQGMGQLTMGYRVNLGSLSRRDIGLGPSFGLDEVGCKEGVDHCRFS